MSNRPQRMMRRLFRILRRKKPLPVIGSVPEYQGGSITDRAAARIAGGARITATISPIAHGVQVVGSSQNREKPAVSDEAKLRGLKSDRFYMEYELQQLEDRAKEVACDIRVLDVEIAQASRRVYGENSTPEDPESYGKD